MCWSKEQKGASSSFSPEVFFAQLEFVHSPEDFLWRRLRLIIRGIRSANRDLNLEAMSRLISLLTDWDNPPPIDDIAVSGVVPLLLQFVGFPEPAFKNKAVLILALLTQSESNQVLVDNGVVPFFVRFLCSNLEQDRAQAVLALRNIVFSSPQHCDHALDCGVLEHLLAQFTEDSMFEVRVATAELLFSFCTRPHPAVDEHTNRAIPVLGSFLLFHYSVHVLTCASFDLLTLMGRGNPEAIERVVSDARIIPRLIALFEHESTDVQESALLIIVHIVLTRDQMHTQVLVENRLHYGLLKLLRNTENNRVMKLICMILDQLTNFNPTSMIESGLVEHVLHHMLQNDDMYINVYGMLVISRITLMKNPDQIWFLVTQGCIEILLQLLNFQDVDIIDLVLRSLVDILSVDRAESNAGERNHFPHMAKFVTAGGLDIVSHLLENGLHDDDVTEIAASIIRVYWINTI